MTPDPVPSPSPAPSAGTILWLRRDLRVADNPALHAARERGGPILALYVGEEAGTRPLGGASRWWLHGSLEALRADLSALGIPLLLRRGDAAAAVAELRRALPGAAVHWNRRYGGPERETDAALKAAVRAEGGEARSFSASLLCEPWTIRTGAGEPYSVFTPFWRRCLERLTADPPRLPLPAPAPLEEADRRAAYAAAGPAPDLEAWGLRPAAPDWAGGLRERWTPGEAGAARTLDAFLHERLERYRSGRDFPAVEATSGLSAHLSFGEISPAQVWWAVDALRRPGAPDAASFLSELGWREFAHHQLYAFPRLATENWRARFDAFPWPEPQPGLLEAWRRGETGVDLVDAGMRELWHTGTMHNRVRMVAASFLTKNLLIDWRRGEEWFWDTLVDADPAANAFNWQWVAGSGADAAPYFRVFNPELQREKFDPRGEYVARWLPERAHELRRDPIVDLRSSRAAALAAYRSLP